MLTELTPLPPPNHGERFEGFLDRHPVLRGVFNVVFVLGLPLWGLALGTALLLGVITSPLWQRR